MMDKESDYSFVSLLSVPRTVPQVLGMRLQSLVA